MKKYEFTGEVNARGLKRIRRLSDGLIGGWIAGENNLSHYNNCFVYGDAKVYGDAVVFGNAKVYGDAWVSENAEVSGNATVSENAWVYGDAWVSENAQVYGNAKVCDNAQVYGNAAVFGNVWVSDRAVVFSNALVTCCLYFQQPRYSITATDTHVYIGWEGYTWECWAEHIGEIGKNYKCSKEEIDQTIVLLNVFYVQIRKQTRC